MAYKIGIDVGGTFTDFLLLGPKGRTAVHKELSTPADPSIAVMTGLATLAAAEAMEFAAFVGDIAIIVHGTTVTTNAVLTGNTARTGLITTRGFRDALQMRRGVRERMYDNRYHAPEAIVPRHLRLPVSERVDAEGAVVTNLAMGDVEAAIERFRAEGIEAVAVCFLHAHANGRHEEAAARMIAKRMPQAYLSVSSRVLPQVRFYERTSTTVLNAGVGPILARYLDSVTRKLAAARFGGALLIMQSNGGVAAPASVARLAAMTLLSGPAAAPAAGLACMAPRGEKNFITVDMGGTSFDAALVREGEPAVTVAASVNGYALALPAMEINTIGAGGGSIAWIDDGGLLHMGPQSAGADPGPACYGRGGMEPTCTDASLVLGYLSEEYFAGGRMRLEAKAAQRAIREKIARPLKLSVVEAAYGMFHVINVNMAAAIREISVQKGYDPREFPLICAGGAGPVHGAYIALELGIPRVCMPRESSIFCASGMLRSDLKHDYVRSFARVLAPGGAQGARVRAGVRALLCEMQAEARAALKAERIPRARQRLRYGMDLRYLGQYHEVTVDIPERVLGGSDWAGVTELFHARHDRLYGYALRDEGAPVELLNVRLTAIGVTDKPPLKRAPRARPGCAAAIKGARPAYLPEQNGFHDVPVYDGDVLVHGNRLNGPAIIESVNTSILVPGGFVAEYDLLGSCVLTRARPKGGRGA
jgi:N-methylhydantoinase A